MTPAVTTFMWGFNLAWSSTGNNNTYLGHSVAYAGYPRDSGNNNTYVRLRSCV